LLGAVTVRWWKDHRNVTAEYENLRDQREQTNDPWSGTRLIINWERAANEWREYGSNPPPLRQPFSSPP